MLKLQFPYRLGFTQGKTLFPQHQHPGTMHDSNRRLVPIVTLLCIFGTAGAAIAADAFLPALAYAQTYPEKRVKEKNLSVATDRLTDLGASVELANPDTDTVGAIADLPLPTETPALIPDDQPEMVPPAIVNLEETIGSNLSVIQPSQPATSLTLSTAAASTETVPSDGDAPSELPAAPDVMGQAADASTAAEIPWRFVLEPYVYLPFETSGDVIINNIEVPFDYDLGEVLESLTFATYGRFEAWQGPWAFVFDGYYFNTVESDSVQINTPPILQGLLPGQVTIDSTVETSFTKLDFAGAYRFGDGNLAEAFTTADTEFDLGPFLFDVIAGVRLYFFSNDIHLTSNIGREFDISRSSTFVEPLLGGRARWNLSDHLAVLAAANVSGFGIGDMTFSLESYAGIDWMFSGNTSLTAAYRITYIDYDRDNSGFNLFQHGPALGVKFRF